MKTLTFALATLAFCSTGCQDALTAEPAAQTRPLVSVQFSIRPGTPPAEGVQHIMGVLRTLSPIFADPSVPWETTHRQLQSVTASAPDSTRWMLEEAGAVQMLTSVLTSAESAGQAAAAAGYVATLADAQSPEIPAVAAAVERFAPTWGVEETSRIARQAVAASEAVQEDRAACETCGPPPNVVRDAAGAQTQAKGVADDRIASATARLRVFVR